MHSTYRNHHFCVAPLKVVRAWHNSGREFADIFGKSFVIVTTANKEREAKLGKLFALNMYVLVKQVF
jgi:hypothetical protein